MQSKEIEESFEMGYMCALDYLKANPDINLKNKYQDDLMNLMRNMRIQLDKYKRKVFENLKNQAEKEIKSINRILKDKE